MFGPALLPRGAGLFFFFVVVLPAACAGAFSFFMDAGIDLNRPRAVACADFMCPACGYPDLPSIEPETLHLLVGAEAVAGWLLADGRIPVHAKGRIYLMQESAWRAYKALCASRESMVRKLNLDVAA